jgi:hypothetical protein
MVVKGATLSHLHGGLMGTFEGQAATVCTSSYSVGHAAVIGRVGGHNLITANTPVAGFLAFNNAQGGALASGSSCAFAASTFTSSTPWTYGLYLPSGAVANGIKTTTTLTGVDVTVSALAAGNTTSGIRCSTTAAAPNNDYGIAGYVESTLTGNQAGTVYNFGSWINLGATFVANGSRVCAQDNGVYSDGGAATLTNMMVICGMRIECQLGAGTNPSGIYLFSTSIAARAFTAIFEVNAAVDLTFTTGGATTNVAKIPLFRDSSGSKTWYVNVYDG